MTNVILIGLMIITLITQLSIFYLLGMIKVVKDVAIKNMQNIEKNIIAIENNSKKIRENNNVKKRTTRLDKFNTKSE